MIWIDTKTQEQADQRRSRMWGMSWTETESGGIAGQVNGEGLYEGDRFWADAIRDTHDDPLQRLAMAKRNLPLPAAFREAAIALRAIIRGKKKAGDDFESELRELHCWAAIQSVAWYDQLDITPLKSIRALDLTPDMIGWNELSVLNKTDRKLMASRWPEPRQHTTGANLYPQIDRNARKLLATHREADLAQSMERLDAMFADRDAIAERDLSASSSSFRSSASSVPKRQGFLARLFGF